MTTPISKTADHLPVIVLVGRVNVGKSTLFNRLIEENKALVSTTPGTTRTRNEGVVLWRGKKIKLVDTGGLRFTDDVPLEEDIIKQSEAAMKEADIILFVADGQAGVLPQETELARRLRRVKGTPVLLVANKVDTNAIAKNLFEKEWYGLGLGEPFPVSASNGRNLGDLLDHVFTMLQRGSVRPKMAVTAQVQAPRIRVSLLGKPNVGKSSLFNKLIGEERVIVSAMPHTTREPHDTEVIYEYGDGKKTKKQRVIFVDTAGIRRKSKVAGFLERAGIRKSIEVTGDSDIVLFVIDGTEPIAHQDMQLGGLLEQHAKSVLILVNKWDLNDDHSDKKRNEVLRMVQSYFPHVDYAPILFVSGKTGQGVHKIYPELMRASQARHIEIPQSALQQFLKHATAAHHPSRGKGTRHPMVHGMRQTATAPPVFEIAVKYRTSLHRSYVEYLKNRLRASFDFYAAPIIIKIRKLKK